MSVYGNLARYLKAGRSIKIAKGREWRRNEPRLCLCDDDDDDDDDDDAIYPPARVAIKGSHLLCEAKVDYLDVHCAHNDHHCRMEC